MSVARIGETQAKQDSILELREFLLSIIPAITSSAGNESCQLYQSVDDPSKFLMVEVWNSVESHRASVKEIPPDEIERIMQLLDGTPSGRYFNLVQSAPGVASKE